MWRLRLSLLLLIAGLLPAAPMSTAACEVGYVAARPCSEAGLAQGPGIPCQPANDGCGQSNRN
jgi:hypothetical protein